MDRWAYENGVQLHFITPGRPMENGYIAHIRRRCLAPAAANHLPVLAEWPIQKNDFDTSPLPLVEKQDLVGVVACQSVR